MRIMKTLIPLFALAFFLTGCAMGPTNNFASPDAPNNRYQIVEGDKIKITKPEPETMGLLESNGYRYTYKIVDFGRFDWTENPTVPDNHMIAAIGIDPGVDNGHLIVPIQYIDKIVTRDFQATIYHSIEGVESPISAATMINGNRKRHYLHEFDENGNYVDEIHEVLVTSNPMDSELKRHNLARISVYESSKYEAYNFFHGEEFDEKWKETTVAHARQMEESKRLREKSKRMIERQEAQVRSALSAKKSVGQQVCSTDKYIGIVEQVAHGRVKMNVIGKIMNGVSSDFLYYEDVPARFDIDLQEEGKLIWRKSNKVGVCNIDIQR